MRNGLAGKKIGKSKSALYYQTHPDAREKKKEYDTEYHKSPHRRKYRALLNAMNREKGNYGNHDNKDEAHVSKKKTITQAQSKNRGDKKNQYF